MVRIPAEYQEVEYIQGTSNARIDTGIPGNNDSLVISGKVYLNKFSAYQGLFGNYIDEDHNTSRLILGATANGAVIANINRRAASSSVTQVGFYAGNVGEFKVSKTKLIFNGTKYSYVGVNNATANDTNILLNVSYPATTTSNSVLYRRWYYFRINDGDTALRNYIPCYRKSDSKPGMYDTVTNQFFAGYGTEEFIVGNDVSWDTASLVERRRQILLNTPHLETISDTMASFKTDVPALVKDCKVYFSPVQDLHGYSNPWPAGGGANAIPYAVAKTETVGGLTFSTDGKGMYTVTGTPTDIGYVYFDLIEPFTIPDGAVNKIHFFNNIAASQIQVAFINVTSIVDTWSVNPAKRSANYSRMSNKSCTRIRIGCTNLNSTNPIDLTLKLMIVPNETVVTNYIPYENICPITGWEGAELYRTGKNLLPNALTTTTTAGITATVNDDGSITLNGTATAYRNFIIYNDEITFAEKANYIFNGGADNGTGSTYRIYFEWYNYDLGIWNGSAIYRSSVPKIVNTDKIHRVMIQVYNGATLNNVTFYPMLRKATETDATYAPYAGDTIPITFPTEAGTVYGGYIDLMKGELVQEWGIVDLGTLTWNYNSSRKMFQTNFTSATGSPRKVICDHYKTVDSDYDKVDKTISLVQWTYPNGQINVSDYSFEGDTTAFKTAMDGVMAAYKMRSPITHQLTPETIKTLKGINNIWSNTNGNIEIKYWKH